MINLPLNIDFTGKVVVITGAGGGICSTMARAFAQAGAKVAALNLSGDKVVKLADELKAEGFICEGYAVNVMDKAALEETRQKVLSDLGPCDILINGTPMHRFVENEELLGATFFLCDERSASAITGVVLPVDAGFAAYSGV